jgi:hypothetical protein
MAKPTFGNSWQILFCHGIVGCIDPKMVGNMADHPAEPASSKHAKNVGGVISNFATNFGLTSEKSWQEFKKRPVVHAPTDEHAKNRCRIGPLCRVKTQEFIAEF